MTKKLSIVAGSANVFLDLGFPEAEARDLLARADRVALKRKTRVSEKRLLGRDAKRDIGAELALSVQQMKAGEGKVVARVGAPPTPSRRKN